jgi:NF-kappa-B inhibitor-like protein 1
MSSKQIKCNDVPWPYSVDVVEIKNVMFHDVLTDDHKYKKRLREEQIRWHPDKFLQKHGKRLCECDRNRIITNVFRIEINFQNEFAIFLFPLITCLMFQLEVN